MTSPEQKEMFDVLEKQRQHQQQVDRVMKIVLPITAFLLAVICANMNTWSLIGTFVVLLVAFFAVGIKRLTLWHWIVVILVYCLADNLLSYGYFNTSGFSRQFGTLFIFVGIVSIGRPYMDRWLMKNS